MECQHDELRRELPAPVPQRGIASRLVDDSQLLTVEGFHRVIPLASETHHVLDGASKTLAINLSSKEWGRTP